MKGSSDFKRRVIDLPETLLYDKNTYIFSKPITISNTWLILAFVWTGCGLNMAGITNLKFIVIEHKRNFILLLFQINTINEKTNFILRNI